MSDKERKIKAVETSPVISRKTEGAVKVHYGYELPEDTVQRLGFRVAQLEETLREAVELLELRHGWLLQDELRIIRIKAVLSSSTSEAKEAEGG